MKTLQDRLSPPFAAEIIATMPQRSGPWWHLHADGVVRDDAGRLCLDAAALAAMASNAAPAR